MKAGLCVLVHGFTGSPEEVEPLAQVIESLGYEVAIPVLQGHCGSKEDLRQATARSWIDSVEPIVEAAVAERTVHLVGFSMGAMLCAILSQKYPVASLTMLSPAVYYVGPQQMFRQIASVIKDTWGSPEGKPAYLRERIDKMAHTPLQSLKQFRRIVQLGKMALPNLHLPMCIIHGKRDEIVEPRSAQYVYATAPSLNKELHILPDSGHMICHGSESGEVNRLVADFLLRLQPLVNADDQSQEA